MPRPKHITVFIATMTFTLCLLSVPPLATQESQVRETILPNGLKVLTLEVHASPIVTTYLWYRVGSRNENLGLTGISHVVEHMMFKGTKQLKSGEIDRRIAGTGGQSNAFTSYDHTAYFITLPRDQLDVALKIEADRMIRSRMTAADLSMEKQVVLSELDGDENDPQQILDKVVGGISFLAHSYRFPVIGFKSDVQALTPQAVKQYYRRYYIPNNAILVIVGDFETDRIMGRVKKLFGSIPRGEAPPPVVTEEPPQEGERRVVVKREGSIPYVHVQFHIPSFRHPDSYPLAVLDMALTEGRSSRLYRALIESQLATSVDSQLTQSLDPGWYSLYLTVRNGVGSARAEEALLAELEKATMELLTPRELQKAINQTRAHFVYANDKVSSRAFYLGYFETIATYKLVESYVEQVRKVTAEDVRRVAEKYFNADNRTVGFLQPIPPQSDRLPENRDDPRATSRKSIVGRSSENPDRTAITHTSSPAPRVSRDILPNGLVLVVQENHANPTVAIAGTIQAGGMYDPPDRPGLADFTAGLLDRGTTGRTSQEIAEQMDFIGSSLDVSGSSEATTFSAYGLSDDFDQILDLLGDVLLHPTFPKDEIEKLRGEALTSLKEQEENPESRSQLEFYSLLYPQGHPYHRHPLGSEEGVKKIGQDDIRAFYHRYYRPDTTILVVVGDVSTTEVQEKVGRIFATWKGSGERVPFSISNILLPEKPQTQVITMEDKAEVIVRLGHTGIARDNPDFYACVVMNHILGGGAFGSRLMTHLREEKGLTYSVFSQFQAGQGAGPWMTTLQVNPNGVDEAIKLVNSNLERIREEGVTDEELKSAQNYLVGRLPLSLESNGEIAAMLRNEELYRLGLDYVERYPSLIRKVSREQIREAARKYLHPDRLITVIVGPTKNKNE